MARYTTAGSFLNESDAREISDYSPEAAITVAPDYAFAFELYESPICDFEFPADLFRLVPIPQNESALHYIGGTIFTPDELRALAIEEGDPDKYRVLIGNVEGNGWGHAIRTRLGNWQPFEDHHILVDEGTGVRVR